MNDELKEMTGFFVEEALELIELSVEDILNMEENRDTQSINRIFRTFHTIKGNSAMLGYAKLSDFTHKAEDLLSTIRDGQIEINKFVINGLLKITDVLRDVFDFISEDYNDNIDMSEGLSAIEKIRENNENTHEVESENTEIIYNIEERFLPETKKKQRNKERLKILIVEDEFVSRAILVDILSKYGDCHVAIDGQEAVTAFQLSMEDTNNDNYDLICMDITMPVLDGLEAVKRIRTLEKDNGIEQVNEVDIIMTTAKRDPKTVIRSLYKYGANAYITKPIDENKLIKEIRKMKYY